MSGGLDRLRRELEQEQKQAARQQRKQAKRAKRRQKRPRRIAVTVIALAAAGGAVWWWGIRAPGPTSSAAGPATTEPKATEQPTAAEQPTAQVTVTPPAADGAFPPGADQARQELNALTVAKNQGSGAYQRREFGPGWGGYGYYPKLPNGCEARDEVLRRDLSDVKAGDRNTCIIFSGVLHDPYTGKELPYNRYKPSDIEIDHVVALGAAWRSGASKWTLVERETFANDPGNMLAVDKQANQDKSSKTPDQWRPPEDYWCPYAERWIGIKSRYHLTVTDQEKSALSEMLARC
jgi:hypothetical protein